MPSSHKKPHHHKKGKFASPILQGRVEIKGNVGFVITEEPGQTDVLVQGPSLRLAMEGDRVLVRVRSTQPDGRRLGEIIGVKEHARKTMVGLFKRKQGVTFLEPETDGPVVRLSDLKGLNPHDGDLVVAKITLWPTQNKGAVGVLEKVLGPRDQAGVDLKALINKYELPDDFPATVEAEARAHGDEVPASALKGRELLFDKTVFTIDGADAKDFDDAVSLEPLPNDAWRLGVHIADVSYYVRENSPLDKEAHERGTSVYLSGSVLPMLPFPLSDNLCSLRPDVVRLTLSCEMDIDAGGNVTKQRVFESAIKSAKRFTYDEVEKILRGEMPADLPEKIVSDVKAMGRLAQRVRKKRFSRGSLDFDFPEPYTITDPHGRPIDIRRRERLESHRLIEDFMLLANESVATIMSKGPFLYRIHEKPDPAKLKSLRATVQSVGVPVPAGFDQGQPKALQAVVAYCQGKPIQAMVQMMILRSLKQAVYSEHNKGHYGLASTHYTHFTSPIRRYPDLIVHRLVKDKIHNKLTGQRQKFWSLTIPPISTHASKRERIAVDAEREFLDVQRVRLMEKRVGEKFVGVISGVTRFGIFVVLKEPFVEGLVHMTNLKDDYYFFDEVRVTLRGKRTGKTYRMGQTVNVLLAGANIVKHQLDFELQ